MEERRGKLWLYGLLPGFAYQLEPPVLNIRNEELQKITELCLERSKWAVLHRLLGGEGEARHLGATGRATASPGPEASMSDLKG